jgi:hypothetical protein
MALQRTVRKVRIGPGLMRYRVLITGEECPPRTHEARQHQFLFLHWLADNQTMLECGYAIPERISVTHNGTCWQAEAEADVEEPDSL